MTSRRWKPSGTGISWASSLSFPPSITIPQSATDLQRSYLEGDARVYIDDNRTPVYLSTGTEDYYLGGWYDVWSLDKVLSLPTTGCPVHDIDSQDNTVAYRFHLSDLVPYYRSFRFAKEHGPEGELPAHYSSTAFYYQVDTPSLVIDRSTDHR